MKLTLLIIWRSLVSVFENIRYLYKGQNNSDYILQLSHRLEKGMCIANPKPMWGWDKANDLLLALQKESFNSFARETGVAVLLAYLNQKRLCGNQKDLDTLNKFEDQSKWLQSQDANIEKGGRVDIKSKELECDFDAVEKLFNIRHSVRDFDDSTVSIDKIYKAVELANRCPSACNRQPTHVYMISQEVWHRYTMDMNQAYNANQHLLITASRSAFKMDEINDWIVSASIFAGYLSLSLAAVGVGSCVIKKGLLSDKAYKKLNQYCGIPKEEKIILEIAIGNYKDTFSVPVSNRKTPQQILTIVN